MEDLKNIKRRERRFYRKIENDKIEYDIKSKENNNILQNNLPGATPEKKEIIENILSEIKNSINPDIDEITEIIYDQLNINNLPIDQETVKEAIYRNRHKNPDKKTEESEKTEPVFYQKEKNQKQLLMISQINYQNQKHQKININQTKIKKKTPKKKIVKDQEEKKKQKSQKNQKKNQRKKKQKTEKPKPKKEPKKSEMELDFGDDVDTEDLNDSESDDDLGLKF